MQDEFDLESLKQVLTELESGSISWTEVHTPHPSPFAQSDGWRQVNQYMYMDDSPRSDKTSRLRGSLLREVVFNAGLRPTVSRSLVERFELKRKRLSPGYSPQTSRELLDWVVERVAIPKGEWEDLLEAMQQGSRDRSGRPLQSFRDKLVQFHPPEATEPLVAAREMLPRIIHAFYGLEKPVRIESLAPVPLPIEDREIRTYMRRRRLARPPGAVASVLRPGDCGIHQQNSGYRKRTSSVGPGRSDRFSEGSPGAARDRRRTR